MLHDLPRTIFLFYPTRRNTSNIRIYVDPSDGSKDSMLFTLRAHSWLMSFNTIVNNVSMSFVLKKSYNLAFVENVKSKEVNSCVPLLYSLSWYSWQLVELSTKTRCRQSQRLSQYGMVGRVAWHATCFICFYMFYTTGPNMAHSTALRSVSRIRIYVKWFHRIHIIHISDP